MEGKGEMAETGDRVATAHVVHQASGIVLHCIVGVKPVRGTEVTEVKVGQVVAAEMVVTVVTG